MATRRMIVRVDTEKPGWASLTTRQKLLYWTSMLLTDDDGILPVSLVSREFASDPFGQEDIDALQRENLLFHYQAGGYEYMQIMFWWDKQFIDKKIYTESKYPRSVFYFARPKNMNTRKKLEKRTYYTITGEALEQNNLEETKEEKANENEPSLLESSEDDLPFLADGSVSPEYANL